MTNDRVIDPVDARILLALDDDPGVSVLGLAKRVGISRNTVHARLARLEREGTLAAPSRRLSPAAFGCHVSAFVHVKVSQPTAHDACRAMAEIPEVFSIHATTGDADFVVMVAARDTSDLQRITVALVGIAGVTRTSTIVSLEELVPYRFDAMLRAVAERD